jgi:drug/metabolite transporter (DMT)-like permease
VLGLIVLGQVPTLRDIAGLALVITGVAIHQGRRCDQNASSGGTEANCLSLDLL